MKFVPRPPQSTQRLPTRAATTTRFLRLQPTEDVDNKIRHQETRPLSVYSAQSRPTPNRTASQRVRLHLDPEVATTPLPNAAQLLREPVLGAWR